MRSPAAVGMRGTGLRLKGGPRGSDEDVSPTVFRLFFEDLDRSLDGGLNANMVAKHSFEGVHLDRRLHDELIATAIKRSPCRRFDPLRHW